MPRCKIQYITTEKISIGSRIFLPHKKTYRPSNDGQFLDFYMDGQLQSFGVNEDYSEDWINKAASNFITTHKKIRAGTNLIFVIYE